MCGADLDCVTDSLRAAVDDPNAGVERAVALIRAAPSSEARWVLVSAAVHHDPRHGKTLCAELTEGSLRARCLQDSTRPHLYAKPPDKRTQPGSRSAPGPHSSTLVLRPSAPSLHAAVPPSAEGCPTGAAGASCATDLAARKAAEGSAAAAAAACLAISGSDHWRGECAFRAAETVARSRGPEDADEAVELCLMSGEWVGRCVDKVHEHLSRLAPPASSGPDGWVPASRAWHEMSLAWARQPAAVQRLVEDAWWAEVVARAYRLEDNVTGDPLDHLPAAAAPHVRAAVAWSLTRTGAFPEPTLAAQVQVVQAALARRSVPSERIRRTDLHRAPRQDFWALDEGREGTIPAVHYLGMSRRAVSDDVEVDVALCVIEAAARRSTAWWPLVEEAARSPAALVSTSARRLMDRAAGAKSAGAAPQRR